VIASGLGRASARAADPHLEMNPELVALARRLRRRGRTKGERLSYRAVAADLAKRGYLNVNGRPYAAESIKAMVSG
jgi:hypothetical protein